MNGRSRKNLVRSLLGVVGLLGVLVDAGVGGARIVVIVVIVVILVVSVPCGVLGVSIVLIVSGMFRLLIDAFGNVVGKGRHRSSQAPAGLRATPLMAPRSLRWVLGLLPDDEGTAWWAEVMSCLAETSDQGERRRYVRSYRRGAPQLIWISWTEHLSTSRSRELS